VKLLREALALQATEIDIAARKACSVHSSKSTQSKSTQSKSTSKSEFRSSYNAAAADTAELAQIHLLLGLALRAQAGMSISHALRAESAETAETGGANTAELRAHPSALEHFEAAIELQPMHHAAMIHAAALLLQEAGSGSSLSSSSPSSNKRALEYLDRALVAQPENEQATILRAIAEHNLQQGA
jgi:tetratricopeptide (TPR) repeat protein